MKRTYAKLYVSMLMVLLAFTIQTNSYSQTVNLTVSAVAGREASATVITLTATASTAVTGNQTVDVTVSGANITLGDYILSSNSITILNGATTGTVTFTVQNDVLLEGTEYPQITISNPSSGITLGANTVRNLVIYDNDYPAAPTASNEIQLSFVSSYLNVSANPTNSAEISAYDPGSERLFIANSLGRRLNIVDMSNPAALAPIASIDITPYGNINSVAVYDGIVAIAIENINPQANGSVVFMDINGVLLSQVTVGAMPDMIVFHPNGNLVLTANEGEPNAAYTNDPEGSISIINISGGISSLTQANVVTANFNAFDSQINALRAAGVRIYGTSATVSRDLEPEYIAFSADGNTAYITLQENNAFAYLDIPSRTITAIVPLGLANHNEIDRGLDPSDQGGNVNISNLPIRGMYQPDAIASYNVGGINYIISANEGDSRAYSGFNEEITVGNAGYVLDPTVFPNAAALKDNLVLGRLQVTNRTGDTDGDGDFDQIHVLGSRSFSIWQPSANSITQVFDSKDQLERITLAHPTFGAIFNANNSIATPAIKNRSDNKGPEPEGVVVAKLNNTDYAFVALERIGGVMTYNVTNPANPTFVQYVNNRSITSSIGDLGAEGIFFIPFFDSPTLVPLIVVSNEISSTISTYSINGPIPAAATNLTATPSTTTASISLNWTDNATNETEYVILRSTTNVAADFEAIGFVAPNITTFTDNTPENGVVYFYKVLSYNDFGVAADSNVPQTGISLPTTATAATNVTTNNFTANWNTVTNANEYRLDVSTVANNFSSFVTGFQDLVVSGTSANVTGLIANTAYRFRVRAVTPAGTSINSNVIDVSTIAGAPTATAATSVSANGFTANWNVVTNAISYRLDVSTDNFTTFLTGFENLTVATTNQVITGLNPFTAYQYRVRVVTNAGTSANSNVINVTTLTLAPVATAATNATQTSFTANWNVVAGATNYLIDVSTIASNFSTFLTGFQNLSVAGTSINVTGLIVNTGYRYRVRAVSPAGTSINSNVIDVVSLPNLPLAPTNLIAQTSPNPLRNLLLWNDNATNEIGYRIERRTGTGSFIQIADIPAFTTTGNFNAAHFDNNVIANERYTYRVRAYNTAGNSAFSNEATIEVTNLEDISIEKAIQIYPNPAEDNTILQVEANEAGYVTIFDINGKIVYTSMLANEKNINQYSIDLKQFVKGAYVVQVKIGKKQISKQLIVK